MLSVVCLDAVADLCVAREVVGVLLGIVDVDEVGEDVEDDIEGLLVVNDDTDVSGVSAENDPSDSMYPRVL